MSERVTLWRLTWSPARGAHWLAMRACAPDLAESWKGIYEQDDAQGVLYVVSKRVPKLPDNARELARHAATL